MHITRIAAFGIVGALAMLVSACGTERAIDEAALASCTSCHGGVDNDSGAPPNDARGDANGPAVGAHSAHIGAGVACESCHVLPERAGAGHPAGRRAQVVFGGLAVADGATPQYDPGTYTCSSVYCHGATLGAGATVPSPSWSQDLGDCLICHGYAPPSHAAWPTRTDCFSCHSKAIEPNNATFKPAHMNGRVDFNL
jgi:predicted CxxxxCH...CXXCH cytochrome family protein